jgi:ribonuclease D
MLRRVPASGGTVPAAFLCLLGRQCPTRPISFDLRIMVPYEHIVSDEHLVAYCERLAHCPRIGFDTEFVSEDTFRPELCLVQVASDEGYAIIDPYKADVRPFWELLAKPNIETIVHAGREEYRFLQFAIQQRATSWFDVQIAAGMIGLEYPASYGSLVSKLTGKVLGKGETRTDWRKRPLTPGQLDYAIQDVVHLFPLRDKIEKKLQAMGRAEWLVDELDMWQEKIDDESRHERWRRVSGISQLPPRGLAIAREVWRWREQEAGSKNRPAKRVLRDDLLVEIARRKLASPEQILSIRGMERRNIQRSIEEIVEAVNKGLALPESECPNRGKASRPPLKLVGQFLAAALSSVCRDSNVAPSLVGGAEAVRDLVAHHLNLTSADDEPPALASGWRAELVGRALAEVLEGKKAIQVVDPTSEQPLRFVDL